MLGTFSFELAQARGGYLHPNAKTAVLDAQGESRGARGRKGAVQGLPMDPSDGPLAGLVEGNT